MSESIIELRDIHGPYRGHIRAYAKTAGEVAIAMGWAEVPVPEMAREIVASESTDSELIEPGLPARRKGR